ncbi:MAG: riboflavin synthase [Candidatus Omnitrophica bacterium]|nr:riboflavin synthase [Candidatus Omnitrophota bacterium]
MFTGLIEETGEINSLRTETAGRALFVRGEEVTKSLKIGESVAVDGVCLTVTEIKKNIFKVFLSHETLACTNLGKARIGTKVNLERAIAFGDRMGGHLVTGHIDAIGRIVTIRRLSKTFEIEIDIPKDDLRLVVPKGSIAVDGVSMTIASLKNTIIKIVIIPHTAAMTTLGRKKRAQGDKVNLEYDIIGKYVQKLGLTPKVSVPFLRKANEI